MSDQEQEQYDPDSTVGIPEHGRERLERMREKHFFTSDLTVNEFLLVKAAGFEPLGLVVGSSIYHIGFQQSRWSKSEEMQVLSEAMYTARELAMTRMEEEADQLGAGGMIGMRIEHRINTRETGGENNKRVDLIVTFHTLGTAIADAAEHRPLEPRTIVRQGAASR